MCKKTLKSGVAWKPKKCSAIFRCAVLEMGNHSAKPWIKPRIMVIMSWSSNAGHLYFLKFNVFSLIAFAEMQPKKIIKWAKEYPVYFFSSGSWKSFLIAPILAFCAKTSLVTTVMASSGHHLTHWGPSALSLHMSHT